MGYFGLLLTQHYPSFSSREKIISKII